MISPFAKLLDSHEAGMRTNRKNDGRPFEEEIKMTAGAYENRNIARLRKISPASRIVGGGQFRKVIFMPNDWPDFAGTWTARHGRALFIETKSTAVHRLGFNGANGVTSTQWTNLKAWRNAGAAVGVLWRFGQAVALFTPEMMLAAELAGAKSLMFENGLPVKQGVGAILWDFLPVLEAAIWPKRENTPAFLNGQENGNNS